MALGMVGTMDTRGWVTHPTEKIDRLIAYWLANRRDQCTFIGGIESYNWVLGRHQSDRTPDDMVNEMIASLQNFLLQAFDEVKVTIEIPGYQPTNKMFSLNISGYCIESNVRYDIANSVLINGQTFELVNEGRLRGQN